MEEYLDIVDENGNPTGEKELRSVVHEKGLWHRVIGVYFYRINEDKLEILVHLRAKMKQQFPLRWLTRFAGHVTSGSSLMETALKETLEEAGISIDAAKLKVGINTTYNTPCDKEIAQTYYYEFNDDINKLSFNDGEVQEVKWMNENEIMKSLQNNPEAWTNSEQALSDIIKDIKRKL